MSAHPELALKTCTTICPENIEGFCRKEGASRERHPLKARAISSYIDEAGLEKTIFACGADGAFKRPEAIQAAVNECRGSIKFS